MNLNIPQLFGKICREGYKSRPARIMCAKDLTDDCALILEESVITPSLNKPSEFEYRLILSNIITGIDIEGEPINKIELRKDGFHDLPYIKLKQEDAFIGDPLYINGSPTSKEIIYSDAEKFFKDINSILKFYDIKKIFERYKNI